MKRSTRHAPKCRCTQSRTAGDKSLLWAELDNSLAVLQGCKKAVSDAKAAKLLYGAFLDELRQQLLTDEGERLIGEIALAPQLDPAESIPTLPAAQLARVNEWIDANVIPGVIQRTGQQIVADIATSVGSGKWATVKESNDGSKQRVSNPVFTLEDTKAINNLSNHTMYWVKENGERIVDRRIAEVVGKALEQGLGRREVAALLKEQLGKSYSVDNSRFLVVASASLNRARNYGRIMDMQRLGISKMIFHATQDERTCPICGKFHGKTYSVEKGAANISTAMAATTPEAFIDAAPWIGIDSQGDMYANTSAGRVPVTTATAEDVGAATPPLHGNCRCELRASYEEFETEAGATSKAEQARVEWVEPADVSGEPLSSKVGGSALARGWHTGEIERAIMPGKKEGFFEATPQYDIGQNGWSAKAVWRTAGSDVVTQKLRFNGSVIQQDMSSNVRVPACVMERVGTELSAMAKAHKKQALLNIKGDLPVVESLTAMKQGRLGGSMRAGYQRWLIDKGHEASWANKSMAENLAQAQGGSSLVAQFINDEWGGKQWTLYF